MKQSTEESGKNPSTFIEKTNRGFTMVELVLAITVTTIASTVILGFYTGVFKGFYAQIGRTGVVSESIVCRAKLAEAFSSVAAVEECSPTSLRFRMTTDTLNHVLSLADDIVSLDGEAVVPDIKRLEMRMESTSSDAQKAALLWEAETKGRGWVAGGSVVSGVRKSAVP